MSKKSKIIVGVAAIVIVAVIATAYFEPHTLFIDDKTNEEQIGSPVTMPNSSKIADDIETSTTSPKLLESQWTSREHETTGSVIVTEDGGKKYLRFNDLKTSNGPDLKVYISKSLDRKHNPVDWINLGDLKGNIGDANYEIPSAIKIEEYKYVTIWCKRFSASFADAPILS